MGEPALQQVVYPDSDGEPMAESDAHRSMIIWLLDVLRQRYRDERIYVTADLLLYYVEGDNTKCLAPDVMVVKDCDNHERGNFRLWEEGRVPITIFEVTSKSTSRRDQQVKPALYGQIGVKELFLIDPLHEWLDEPLMGYTFTDGKAVALVPDEQGRLPSEELGLTLEFVAGDLILSDTATGETLCTEAEAALGAAHQEHVRAEREHARAEREWARAEQERHRAQQERRAKEAERARAEQESQRAEQERREKEAEHARAERLEAELAALRARLEAPPS